MFYKDCYWILPRLGYVSTLSTLLLLSSSYSMSLLFISFSASTNSTSCSHLAGVGGRTKQFLQFFFSTSFNLRLHHLGHHLIFPLLLNSGHLLCSDAFQMFGQLWNKQSLSALFNVLLPLNHLCLHSAPEELLQCLWAVPPWQSPLPDVNNPEPDMLLVHQGGDVLHDQQHSINIH